MSGSMETTFKIGAVLSSNFAQAFGVAGSKMSEFQQKTKALSSVVGNIKAYQRLQFSITKNQAAMHSFQTKALALRSSLNGDLTGNAERGFSKLMEQSRTAQEAIDRNKEAMERLRPALAAAGVDLNNLGSEYSKFAAQTNSVKLDALKEQLKWGNIVNGFMTAAQPMMVFKGPVQEAASFEQQMARVKAVAGLTGEAFTKLQNQARQLGRDTQFSAVQAAQAQENLARAGFNSNEIMGAMPGLLNMAAAEGMDLANAANIASSALRSFGIDAKDMDHVADILAATSSAANTNIAELGEGLKYVGATAHTLGVPLENVTAMLGLLANNGLQSSMAGTSLNAMFKQLKTDKAIKQLNKMGVALKTDNGEFRRVEFIMADLDKALGKKGKYERGKVLDEIFADSSRAVSILMDSLKSAAKDAEDNIKINPDTGKAISQFEDLTNSIKKCDGKAADAAKTMGETAQGALTRLGSATSNLKIALGNVFLPVVADVADILASATGAVSDFAEAHPFLTRAVLGSVAGFGALKVAIFGTKTAFAAIKFPFAQLAVWKDKVKALGGLNKVFRVLGSSVSAFSGKVMLALKTLGAGMAGAFKAVGAFFMSNPAGWIIGGVTAAIGAAYLLYKNWDSVKAGIAAGWKWLTDKITDFKNWLSGLDVWNGLKTAWAESSTVLTEGWNAVEDRATEFKNWLSGLDVWDGLKTAWAESSTVLAEGWNAVEARATDFKNWLSGLDVWTGLKTAWAESSTVLAEGWNVVGTRAIEFKNWLAGLDVWNGLKTAWAESSTVLTEGWNAVEARATDFKNWLSGLDVWDGLKTAWDISSSAVAAGWKAVGTRAIEFKNWLAGLDVWNGLKTAWAESSTVLTEGWKAVGTRATEFKSWLAGLDIWNGLKTAWAESSTVLTEGWKTVETRATEFKNWLSRLDVWTGLKTAWAESSTVLTEGWKTVETRATEFKNWLAGLDVWTGLKTAWAESSTVLTEGWNVVEGRVTEFKNWLSGLDVWNGLKTAWAESSTVLTEGWNAVEGRITDFKNWLAGFDIWDGLKTAWAESSTVLTEGWKAVEGRVTDFKNWLSGLDVWTGFSATVNVVSETANFAVNGIKEYLKAFGSWLTGIGGNLWNGLVSGLKVTQGFVMVGIDKIKEYAIKFWNWLSGVGTAIWQGFVDGFNACLKPILDGIESIKSALLAVPEFLSAGFKNSASAQIQNVINPDNANESSFSRIMRHTASGFIGARAAGGIITRPELSWIGEAGPEAVIPLSDKSRGIPLLERTAGILGVGSTNTNTINSSPVFHFTINGAGENPENLAALIGEKVESVLADIQDRIARTGFETA